MAASYLALRHGFGLFFLWLKSIQIVGGALGVGGGAEDRALVHESPVRPKPGAPVLLGGIRRARNNLFYGGKSGDADRHRSDVLIAEAIAVIKEILRSDDDLHFEFEGQY